MSTLVSLPGATPVAAPDYQSLERPLNFTESAAAKVKSLIQKRATPTWPCVCTSRAAAVRASSTGSSSTRTVPRMTGGTDQRGDPAGRSAEPAVPDGRRGGLHREPDRCPVRDPQPERKDHLRLRQQLQHVRALWRDVPTTVGTHQSGSVDPRRAWMLCASMHTTADCAQRRPCHPHRLAARLPDAQYFFAAFRFRLRWRTAGARRCPARRCRCTGAPVAGRAHSRARSGRQRLYRR